MKRSLSLLLSLLLSLGLLTGCGGTAVSSDAPNASIPSSVTSMTGSTSQEAEEPEQPAEESVLHRPTALQELNVPEFSGEPYVAVNNNVPFFTSQDHTTEVFEEYSELDALRRCGTAYANVCQQLMPTADREGIGHIYPSGWTPAQYDCVPGGHLYNRCHLIGFQLSGENDNNRNLITGTRYLNIEGMLPFEEMVADYVKETDNHVLYRVTPFYEGDNLVASGVLMEGWSVEDEGDGICFCVYAYNNQPGVEIDYATGESQLSGTPVTEAPAEQPQSGSDAPAVEADYVLNTNTHKFHNPSCSSAKRIKDENRQDYSGARDDLLAQGYEPCKNCDP